MPRRGAFWARAFHYNYRNYCRSQERRTPQFQALMDRLRTTYGSPALAPQPWKDAFLAGSRPLMWMTNFLTFNSRAILIYATCLLDCPWVYLFMEIVVYNLIYVSMHTRHENLCAHMAACLETAASTTARPGFCETDDDLVDHEAASCDTRADIEP